MPEPAFLAAKPGESRGAPWPGLEGLARAKGTRALTGDFCDCFCKGNREVCLDLQPVAPLEGVGTGFRGAGEVAAARAGAGREFATWGIGNVWGQRERGGRHPAAAGGGGSGLGRCLGNRVALPLRCPIILLELQRTKINGTSVAIISLKALPWNTVQQLLVALKK